LTPELRDEWFSPVVIPGFFSKSKMSFSLLESSKAIQQPTIPPPIIAMFIFSDNESPSTQKVIIKNMRSRGAYPE
jgi:hypothetical protein